MQPPPAVLRPKRDRKADREAGEEHLFIAGPSLRPNFVEMTPSGEVGPTFNFAGFEPASKSSSHKSLTCIADVLVVTCRRRPVHSSGTWHSTHLTQPASEVEWWQPSVRRGRLGARLDGVRHCPVTSPRLRPRLRRSRPRLPRSRPRSRPRRSRPPLPPTTTRPLRPTA